MDWAGAVDCFLKSIRARNLSRRTYEYYDWQLGQFSAWLAREGVNLGHLGNITPALIRSYLVNLQERGLKDSSIHAAARAIRAFSIFCEGEELVTVSPMRKVKMPKRGQHILPAIPLPDVKTLLENCDTARDRALILFLLDSGCRVAELVALDVGDVNTVTGVVRIVAGKGNKDRITAIEDVTRAALAAYIAERGDVPADAPLWVGCELAGARREGRALVLERRFTGVRMTTRGVQSLLNRLKARTGIACAPHAFRRTCALSMYRSGARLTEIAQLLGHSDLATLQRYLDLQNQDAVIAHRKHSPVEALLGA